MPAIKDQFPLRLLINGEDVTFLVDENFSFSSTDPGGFEAASFPIPRDMPELERGDHVRLECGMETAWEGRIKEIQRSLGAKTLIQCEGNAAILRENTIAEIFVDRDLTKWVGPGIERQKKTIEAGYSPSGPQTIPDEAGEASLLTSCTGSWAAGGLPSVQGWYKAQGLNIGAIYYSWVRNANIFAGDANWKWTVFGTGNEAEAGGRVTTGNLRAEGPSGGYISWGGGVHFAGVELSYGVAGATQGMVYSLYWPVLAVYGFAWLQWRKNNKLTVVEGVPAEYWVNEIVEFCVGEVNGIQPGVIDIANVIGFLLPHAAYVAPVPAEQIISDMAKFAGWHWGVWESLTYLTGNQEPRLDFRPYPAPGSPTAWAWRQDCEGLDLRENIENLYDSAKVTYTEPGGEEQSVKVSRPNPALEAVNLHRQVVLNAGITTQLAAEAYGLIQLKLLEEQANVTGTCKIISLVSNMDGTPKPAWMLRAGLDRLRIPDNPCPDVWGERNDFPISRVECTGGETGLQTSVEFGLGPNLIETLQAQLQAAAVVAL